MIIVIDQDFIIVINYKEHCFLFKEHNGLKSLGNTMVLNSFNIVFFCKIKPMF